MPKKSDDVLLFLRLWDGTVTKLKVDPSTTTTSVLRRVAAQRMGVEEYCVRLTYESKCLVDTATLVESHVRSFSVVYLTSFLNGGMNKDIASIDLEKAEVNKAEDRKLLRTAGVLSCCGTFLCWVRFLVLVGFYLNRHLCGLPDSPISLLHQISIYDCYLLHRLM